MIASSAYDPSPRYKEAVIRAWTHDYGGDEGLALFATVWDAQRQGFFDYCYGSGDNLWGGEAFVDATDDLFRLWNALRETARAPVPPPSLPKKGDLLDRKYGG